MPYLQSDELLNDMPTIKTSKVEITKATKLTPRELSELCDATELTTTDNKGFSIGFSRSYNVEKSFLENYFKGVLVIPERELYVAKLDGVIAGSIQMLKPHPSHETINFACSVDNHFVVPWARGYGIAKLLIQTVEEDAKRLGFTIIKLSVRETRYAAISLYESMGFVKWGSLPYYEFIDGKMIGGKFYYKPIK